MSIILRSSITAFCLLAFGTAAPGATLLTEMRTDRARYTPGMPVVVSVTLSDAGGLPVRGSLRLTALHLDNALPGPADQSFRLTPGASQTLRFTWQTPRTDFQGYVFQATALDTSGKTLDRRTTAADVSSDWTRFLRYGYVSEFSPQLASTSQTLVRQLADYHLNALQFYDWQFKHHHPLAGTVAHPAKEWKDLANRPTSRRTILDLIHAAHGFGMAAMNYNLLYGAWSGYGDGVDYHWGLWRKTDGTDQYRLPMPGGWATPALFIFNPGDPGWQHFLIGQEANVFAAYPFDGWQVDQVGDPGTVYNFTGKPVDLWKTFRPFLNAAHASLNKPLVFNNVGGYGLYDTAAHADTAAVYVECWPFAGQATYNDLKTVIDQATSWSGGKAVVLAAYMDYERSKAAHGRETETFNAPGVLLTDAAIFASGGAHIELGDGSQLLGSEYFPNRNLRLSPALRSALRNYYDFLVGYENILRGGLENSAGTISLNVPSSTNAAPNAVWTFAKHRSGHHVLHLINLTGENSNAWRDDQGNDPAPTAQTNVAVTYHCGPGKVKSVFWASPDARDIAPRPLSFTTGADAGGAFVRFTIPQLDYWDMVSLTLDSE